MTDNSWSDDENEEIELKQDNRDFPPSDSESEDDEEYYEMLKIINSKNKTMDFESCNINSNKSQDNNSDNNIHKKNKIQNNKKFVKLDLTKLNKPKTWVSKRMQCKKGPEIRKFSPKLPIPNF